MKKLLAFIPLFGSLIASAQTNPAITRWLQNTSVTARHYVAGNSTPINDAGLVNVQSVKYSANFAYATTTGLPAYVTGPFLDGNINLAGNQNAIFKFPLAPVQNTGTPVATTGGNIGVFINGVALFDYRDGVSWQNSTNSLKGGPLGGMGDGVWNRDAVVGERLGFDCSKGHPAGTNYHHHQNPSAFKLDLTVISTICNLYTSDALYAIDSTQHSPLIGFAYDGFPIYGAYGYKNTDGTGGIVRMKSSYTYRNITTRTTYSNGSSVTAGPPVSTTYPLGYFREDYQYNATSAATPDYLDDHNGRFCITPEYPLGTYCYFATVKSNWNSAYPYIVGPTFYGTKTASKVPSITETVTTYPVNTTPSLYIAASAKTICSGQTVAFTSAVYNGGLMPSFQWKKNGSNVGANSKTYTASDLVHGDVITCVLTTASMQTATSNSISFVVNQTLTPSLSISPASANICAGSNVTFTATPVNGGSSPAFQWKKNGNNVGSGLSTYSDATLVGSDQIYCVLTSNLTCKTSANATSTAATLSIKPAIECYCVPSNSAGICITNVTLNAINNTTNTCISPFTSQQTSTTQLNRGSTYSISVSPALDAKLSMWIDYNQNGLFEGSEWYAISAWAGAAVPAIYSFSVPVNATLGLTGLRIRSSDASISNGALDACTQFAAGESEDYTIMIGDAVPVLNSKVFLNHVNATSGKMGDDLKALTNFPVSDPYLGPAFNSKFVHYNNANTSQQLNNSVLSVSGDNSIVDWVFVELRSGASNATSVLYTRSALLQSDGDVVDLDGVSPLGFSSAVSGDYYVAIRHRNHLGFRTANLITINANTPTLNFTNNSVALYGASPLRAISGNLSAMFGGDANADGSVDALDTVHWENQNGLFDDYQLNADGNLDGSIDAIDAIIWENSNGLFEEL
ncbi:MAG: YHYH protein [Saprospiraceae bacterium]